MKMVNMAMKPDAKGKSDGCCCCGPCECESERPRYPWGLQLCLESEQLAALGILELPKMGSSMTITAVAKVTRCSEEEVENGEPRRSVSLQITDIGIDIPEEKRTVNMAETAAALYGKSEE